jgi:CheY-like chemotaxis protein
MIVEDQPENISVLVELLQDSYQIMAVTSGGAAMKRLGRPPLPDLVLLDIVMPGVDGYAVCSQLKSDPVTADIPVIFITAVSEVMDDAKAFELGAVDYITKPFNPLTVKARVNTQIRLSRALTELQSALDEIKTLNGLIPICSYCKKIRDDQGYWEEVDTYISERSEAVFSHGMCPACYKTRYPKYYKRHNKRSEKGGDDGSHSGKE